MSQRDEQDFAEFYDATWGRTVACAYALTGDLGAAEDVAQEAYSRAWPRWSRLRDYDDPGAWVRQVATRAAVSGWRRRRTALRHLARQRPPEPAPPPDETSLVLVEALRAIPEAQRRSIVLHHLAGLPVAEVAAVERCPEGTVKARLSRGRAALEAEQAFAVLSDPGSCAVSPEQVPLADRLAEAVVLRVPSQDGNPPSAFWAVRDGSMVGLLTVSGAPEQPSAEVAGQVALATLAAVPYTPWRAGLPGGPTEVPSELLSGVVRPSSGG